MVHPRLLNRLTARNVVATIAFLAIVIGLWLERPSLALIVPGAFVFGCLAYTHLRGERKDA